MRKVFLLVIILISGYFTTFAQTERGKFVIGVSSSFGMLGSGNDMMSFGVTTIHSKSDADGFTEPDPDKMTSFNLMPKLGIFALNNLLIGLDINLAYSKYKDDYYNYESTSNLLGVGPFIRYYIPTSVVKPFIESSTSFGSYTSKYSDDFDSSDDKESIFTYGGGIGMAVPLGDIASFDLLGYYSSFTLKDTKDNPNNNRYVYNTFGLKIGFVFYLGR